MHLNAITFLRRWLASSNELFFFRNNSCLFGHFFFYTWFGANIVGRPHDWLFWFSIFLIQFLLYSLVSLRGSFVSCEQKSKFLCQYAYYDVKHLGKWFKKFQKCVCVCARAHLCAFVRVYARACIPDVEKNDTLFFLVKLKPITNCFFTSKMFFF